MQSLDLARKEQKDSLPSGKQLTWMDYWSLRQCQKDFDVKQRLRKPAGGSNGSSFDRF